MTREFDGSHQPNAKSRKQQEKDQRRMEFRRRTLDIGAAIASGSFCTAGMIVAPCSMRTLALMMCASAT